MYFIKDYFIIFLIVFLVVSGELARKKFNGKFLKDFQTSKNTFLTALRLYWIIYWPFVYLFKMSHKFFTGNQNLLILFIFYAVFVVFFIQNLRAIYLNSKKENKTGFLNILFVLWSSLFIVSIVVKTVLYFFDYINGVKYFSFKLEFIFFVISVFGEWLFFKKNKFISSA